MPTQSPSRPDIHFAVLAADTALFSLRQNELVVRLIAIDRPPHYPAGSLGLPGGLLDPSETAEQAAVRHLENKAGIPRAKAYLEQLYTFSEVARDPRGRVVAVAYLALVPWGVLTPDEQSATPQAWWQPVGSLGTLAYDHNQMVEVAVSRLRSRIGYTTLISKLLPPEFTLTELETAYACILGERLDRRNFRKKVLKLNILQELPYKRSGLPQRPAQLYQFRQTAVVEIDFL